MSEDAPHYARGSIVLVQFEPLKAGSKKRKVRPCVIVTNGIKIRRSRHAELLYGIVPLTTRSSAAAEVLAPRFVAREGGLPADAVALCIHFRTVGATRVAGYVGELNTSEIDDLEESLIKLFHINKNWKVAESWATGRVRSLIRTKKGEGLASALAELFDIEIEPDKP